MTWPVVIAIAGALAVAAGAAFQERAVVAAPRTGGQLRLLGSLLRSKGWCLGTFMTASGVLAHMVALGHAPLVIVQPIGMSGLMFAVMLSAFFRRQRLTPAQVFGSLAVTAALIGLLATIPDHASSPVLTGAETVLLPLGCAGAMLLAVAAARFSGPTTSAWILALAGGVAYGGTSALARVIGSAAVADLSAVLQPLTAVGLVIGLSGAVIVQNSYRTGHFALAYSVLLISAPLAATAMGVAFFDERLPTGLLDGTVALAAAVLGAVGVVTLARSSGPPTRQRADAAPRSAAPSEAAERAPADPGGRGRRATRAAVPPHTRGAAPHRPVRRSANPAVE
ncbi:DMT family transporter [Streptomonospora nanhaiensis]|uniref:Drug/metabolite transporter (DMT)-like permease n=1 Tax=Streptomonospora nanhaiensis TaxID=1323731 RepID=A0A853BR16_9ACTN|nr:DMT family transporter [Streptomonospora nanhaiensis]NYI97613.1 drug/metabolite transporter (DMT)-like permease [Streptomonospora nanhaiensis]